MNTVELLPLELATEAAFADIINPNPGPDYCEPGLEVFHYPTHANMFDGFSISGRAWGSDLGSARVRISIAGVTRHGLVRDGLWTVIFDDGSLPQHRYGLRRAAIEISDAFGCVAKAEVVIEFEQFVDSYITIDSDYAVTYADDGAAMMRVKGELNLGTHLDGRELVVLLVCDPVGCPAPLVGEVEPGWRHGEWRATFPLARAGCGPRRIRAQLMDNANPALTRVTTSGPVTGVLSVPGTMVA